MNQQSIEWRHFEILHMKFYTEKHDIESQFLFFLFFPFEFVDADNFDAGFDVIFSRLIFSIAKNIVLQ